MWQGKDGVSLRCVGLALYIWHQRVIAEVRLRHMTIDSEKVKPDPLWSSAIQRRSPQIETSAPPIDGLSRATSCRARTARVSHENVLNQLSEHFRESPFRTPVHTRDSKKTLAKRQRVPGGYPLTS